MVRECCGLPEQDDPCPLCLSLRRLGDLGHRGRLTAANYNGLVNRVRILYGEVLDILQLPGGASVAAEVPRVDKPPGKWEEPVPGRGLKEERKESSPVSKVAEEAEASRKKRSRSSGDNTGAVEKTEVPADSEVEERSTKDSPVAPEDEEVAPEEKRGLEEESIQEAESPVDWGEEETEKSKESPKKVKKDKKKKHSKKAKDRQDRKKEKKDSQPHRGRSREKKAKDRLEPIGASPRLKEKLETSSQPLRLRPKSPPYPPPSHRDQASSGRTRGREESEDSRDFGEWKKGSEEQRYKSYWRENYEKGEDYQRRKKRSKGQTRIQRWEDIKTFGPDPERKKLREHQQDWWWWMPPLRVRRPAAKGAAIGPKAKAKAGAGGVRRPAAAALAVGRPESPVEKFQRGENVEATQVPVDQWKKHEMLVFDKAIYFGKEISAAGRFRDLILQDGNVNLKVNLSGTNSEDLLKHGTAVLIREAMVHCCAGGCVNHPEGPLLLHSQMVRRVKVEDEGSLTWEKNMEVTIPGGDVDEVEALRKKEEELRSREDAKEKDKKEGKRKKKKEKSGEKKKDLPSASSSGSVKETGKSQKYGGRANAKKSLEQVYGRTGLDPKPKIRRKVMLMVKKRIKKKGRSSSSSSSEGTSSSPESVRASDLMDDMSRVRMVARYGPGVLTAAGLSSMRESLADLEGAWLEEGNLHAPISLRYVRTSMAPKLSGGALRESMTLGTILDLGLQGRVTEAMDTAMQRLKSIEAVGGGATWATGEKLELLPSLTPQIRSRGEMASVNRERKLDLQAQPRTAPAANTGKGWTPPGKGKSKNKSDEKGSKGKKKGGEGKKKEE